MFPTSAAETVGRGSTAIVETKVGKTSRRKAAVRNRH
jgi:hypothetical protein